MVAVGARRRRLVPLSTPDPSLLCEAARLEVAVLRAMLGLPPETTERRPPKAPQNDQISPDQDTPNTP